MSLEDGQVTPEATPAAAADPFTHPPAGAPDPALGTEAAPASESEADATPGSLAEHERTLGERDEQGRFKEGARRGRHRARSQQAGPGDAPRIAELTRRLRETEAERDRLKTPSSPAAPQATPAPAAAPATTPRAAAPPPKAVASTPPPAAADDPEPAVEAFDDYSAWIKAHNRWSAREELRERDKVEAKRTTERQQHEESERIARGFEDKITAAKTKYPDFQQVALDAPSAIPRGSLIDAWIFEHKTGADVLYHFQKNAADLQRVLALPLLDQVEELTLLGQRLSTPPKSAAAVSTGAAPTAIATPAPRPPTPVRTGPMRASSEMPGDDASLRDHEKFFEYKGRRR